MLTSEETLLAESREAVAAPANPVREAAEELLRRGFAADFALVDGASGEVLYDSPGQPQRDWGLRAEMCREVARRGRVEFLDDEPPLATLAIPLAGNDEEVLVAVSTFVTRPTLFDADFSQAAQLLGMRTEDVGAWANGQRLWSPDALQRMGEMVQRQWLAGRRLDELETEAESLTVHLASTYEEISLLYRLTRNLRISQSDEALGRMALEWLAEVLPARGFAIQYVPAGGHDQSFHHESRTQPALLTRGECPIDNGQLSAVMERIGAGATIRPVVVNPPATTEADWPCPQVRQMIAVALTEGENLFGWLAAINHADDAEFGTVEASLLSSVAAILGIHSGNIELYRQQSELLAQIVRALTSAIDAKDPYTCGHSDRVARLAVRLAEELGSDAQTLNTIYLSGLLHDIGKIGIDDNVLRKPDKLTDAEYEHIKKHVEIGHRILRDLRKLGDVLPVVLHHHEAWDGRGYPHRLDAEAIPLAARIVAVADSYDAMGSDRPYRNGMPDEKIDQIFRSGSGQQWDPQVIAAFFRARDDLRRIAHEESEAPLSGIRVPV
jgi:putative nucleotidyltransferase with HDIG domain